MRGAQTLEARLNVDGKTVFEQLRFERTTGAMTLKCEYCLVLGARPEGGQLGLHADHLRRGTRCSYVKRPNGRSLPGRVRASPFMASLDGSLLLRVSPAWLVSR